MCTAATLQTKDFYFGRNLDFDFDYGEEVVVTPRNYEFKMRNVDNIKSHYAMVGMAMVADDYPLYFDGINEKGLGMGGLMFANNAYYRDVEEGKDNIAQFEFIPWILGQCATVKEAKVLLAKINITNVAFSDNLPLSDLHWMIADKDECIVVESVKEGVKVYENPIGILTNNPTFDVHMLMLANYSALSPVEPQNNFAPGVDLPLYSRGMGSIGLPGDPSSASRFVKAAFTKEHSICGDDELSSVNQFFHILHSVEQQNGITNTGKDKYEYTLYSSCGNTAKGIYYYTTYTNHQISAVDMNRIDLDTGDLARYPKYQEENIKFHN